MKERSADIDDILLDLKCNGESELYVIELGGLEFICRPLSYSQYTLTHQVLEDIGDLEANELVLKMAILHPERKELQHWIDNSDASTPDKLAMSIVEHSNYASKEAMADMFDQKKDECNTDFMSVVQIYISKAFGISPLEIAEMSVAKTMSLLAKAEHMLDKEIDVRTLLGLEEEKEPDIQMPIAPGMQSTDPMSREFMMDPNNSSDIPPEAFG